MLEDIAVRYVNSTEADMNAIGYGSMILGAVVAGVVNQSNAQLARAPYFAYSALILLLVSAVQIVWLHSLPAMAGGYLWVLITLSLGAIAVGGLFYGKIAMARSRDAYGHGRMAALALIPFANFWLLLAPSKNAITARRNSRRHRSCDKA